MQRNIDAHRAAHEAFLRRDWDAVKQLVVPGFMYTDHPRNLTVKSAEEFVEWTKGWFEAFSDATPADAVYHDAGDTSIALFVGRGTNDGPMGPFPATGLRMSVPFCEVLRFDPQGKAVSGEIYYDQMSILTQLGHVPGFPAA